MKIRTDFVTNSSSSSFVTYRITPGGNEEAFMQLRILIERLCSKYEQYYVPNTYVGGDALSTFEGEPITLTMWTPGLSDNYLDEADDDEMEEKEREFHEFARWDGSYPPSAAVALSALFGDMGDEMGYLSRLTSETELLDSDGQLSDEIHTNLTRKEIGRLIELLDKVRVEETEIIGGTD